jgi:hypothetical protein
MNPGLLKITDLNMTFLAEQKQELLRLVVSSGHALSAPLRATPSTLPTAQKYQPITKNLFASLDAHNSGVA